MSFNLKADNPEPRFNFVPMDKPATSLTDKYRPKSIDLLVGQSLACQQIQGFVDNPFSQVFLFHGPTGTGKSTMALAIANHLGAVDFGGLEVIKSGMQDAEAVETALKALNFTPMLGSGWKVVIVEEADYMSPKASQVWLSALEDLPNRSVIIFTTNNPDKMSARFRDRCESIEFSASSTVNHVDATELIGRIWFGETGRHDAPTFEELNGSPIDSKGRIVDADGSISYRRIVRAIEARLRQMPAIKPVEPVKVESQPEPTPEPTPIPVKVAKPRKVAPMPLVQSETINSSVDNVESFLASVVTMCGKAETAKPAIKPSQPEHEPARAIDWRRLVNHFTVDSDETCNRFSGRQAQSMRAIA